MFRTVRVVVIALLAALAPLATSAAPAAAAPCTALGTGTVPGGYAVTIYCNGPGYINGYGSTLSDANDAAYATYDIYVRSGVSCYNRGEGAIVGGYAVTGYCNPTGNMQSYGTTLTDASAETRGLADLYLTTHRACNGTGAGSQAGSYSVRLFCTGGVGYVNGVGATLTAAARAARLAATTA